MIRVFPRRRPLVRQHEPTDCGPTSLLTILRYWGGDTSLVEVRELALTDAQGTTLWGLKRAAEALGFEARGVRGSYDEVVSRQPFPCIVHLTSSEGDAHYAVWWNADAHRVSLGDPSAGPKTLQRREMERLWTSRAALLLEPTAQLRRAPPGSWIPWLAGYARGHGAWIVQSVFLGATGTALGLVTALCVQQIIDRFIPEGDPLMIAATGGLLLALLVLRTFLGHVRRGLLISLQCAVSSRMNQDFLARLFRLPLRFFESRATGDVTVRLAEAVRVQDALAEMLGTVIIDGLVVAGSLVLLAVLAPPLAVLALAAVPVYVTLLLGATWRLRDRQKETISAYSRVEVSYIDSLGGIEEVLGSGAGPVFAQANAGLFRAFQGSVERVGRIQSQIALLAESVGAATVLAALVWGALLTVEGRLRLGELVAGYSLLGGMLPSADRLVGAVGTFQEASVSAHRLLDVVLARPETLEGGRTPLRVTRELRLRDATVEWPPGRPVLEGIDLVVSRGRLTALFGPNGAGKTTLMRALARLIPLTAGRLLVDGAPAEEYALGEYRKRIALCPGSPRIFRGTLGHNVLLGRDPERLNGLTAWAAGFGLASFLTRFPAGWDTRVGEDGRRLSGGERQIVGFLRAVATTPEVLLVDEALGAIDGRLATVLMEALTAYAVGHAVLVVSHDAHVLDRSDHVYLLEAGRVRGEGRPGEIRQLVRNVPVQVRSHGDRGA